MGKLLQLFWEICLLRAGPQDLPASHSLLGLALVAYVIINILVATTFLPQASTIVFATTVDTLLLISLSWLILWVRMLTNRWNQTFTALAGTGCFFQLIIWPLSQFQPQVEGGDRAFILPSLLMLAILVWNLIVFGHILRHALSTSLMNGTLLAVIYQFSIIFIMRNLIAAAAG